MLNRNTFVSHTLYEVIRIRPVPLRAAAADLVYETLENLLALLGVRHFRVELHSVVAPFLV